MLSIPGDRQGSGTGQECLILARDSVTPQRWADGAYDGSSTVRAGEPVQQGGDTGKSGLEHNKYRSRNMKRASGHGSRFCQHWGTIASGSKEQEEKGAPRRCYL